MKSIMTKGAALLLISLLAACNGDKKTNNNDNGSGGGVATKIHISVADAAAGFVDGDVKLTFAGLPVLDENQQPVSTLTVPGGQADDITVNIAALPSQPSALAIRSHADGYLDGGQSVVIPATAIEKSVSLRLTQDRPGPLGDGIFSTHLDISGSIDPATGEVTEEIVLLNRPGAGKPALQVKIPVGTVLKDKDGNPVRGGVLKVTSYDPTKPRALLAYPGGMNVLANVDGFTGIDGTAASGKQQINFKTAGFASIVIEAEDGSRVKQFSQNIEIAMQFPVGTKDADGNTVQVGDAVPIWSFDESSGEWRFEKDGTAADLDPNDGLLDVIYETDHLTAWNLDWHYSAVCTANINIIDSLGANQLSQVDHLVVNIPDAPIHRTLDNYNPSNGEFLLYNVPVGYVATITAYDANGNVLGTLTTDDLCGGNAGTGGWNNHVDNEVDLVIGDPATPTDVSLTVSCPVPGVNVPGFNSSPVPLPAVLSPTNGSNSITLANGSGPVGAGSYTLSAIPGGTNLINVIDWGNNGNPASNLLNISGAGFSQNFVLTNAFCSPTAGNIDSAACGAATMGQYNDVAPFDVAKDSAGNLYISTGAAHGILKRDTSGNITTFIAPGGSNYPSANPTASNDDVSEVTVANALGLDIYDTPVGEILLYADRWGNCINAVNLNTGNVATVVGKCQQQGGFLYSTDVNNLVSATDGRIWQPTDVAADPAHQVLYLTVKGRVLMVSADGDLWRVAGSGPLGTTDFTPPVNALTTESLPYMLDVDAQGRPVFSEPASNRILRVEGITLTGLDPLAAAVTLTKVAGSYAQAGFSGDGGPAANAKLSSPRDIEIDGQDNILVADHFNHRVRRIDAATGNIDTVAGTGGIGAAGTINGCGLATQTDIRGPNGLWFEPNSDFYLTQGGSAAQRMVRHVTY